jgi:hypothetical protein
MTWKHRRGGLTVKAFGPAVVASVLFAEGCLAAPAGLTNKTIVLSWSVASVQRLPDGRVVNPLVDIEQTIYVSSAGRLFARTTKTATGRKSQRSETGEMAPGDEKTPDGLSRQLRFAGRRLIGDLEYHSGAGRVTIDFGPDFRSCTMNVVFGRSGGAPIRWKGMDGTIREVISAKVASQTCSIREGNAFAGN